jgi:hypothetical protein
MFVMFNAKQDHATGLPCAWDNKDSTAGAGGDRHSTTEADGGCQHDFTIYSSYRWWYQILFSGIYTSDKVEQPHCVSKCVYCNFTSTSVYISLTPNSFTDD